MRSVADDLREELLAETAALSPLDRLEQSFRLWEEGLEAFRQQHGLDRETAIRVLQRNKQAGRRPSKCMSDLIG